MLYYIEIFANTCKCKVVLNGLGITELNAEKIGSVQYPCNTELIGKSNTLAIEIMPSTLDFTVLSKIKVEGYIKRYSNNESISPESGTILTTFSLQEKIDEIKANPLAVNLADIFPFAIKANFDNDDGLPSFTERLTKSKPVENKELLKDWAIAFRALLEKRDSESLYALYEPKLIDYDIAYPDQKEPDNRIWFKNWMTETIFPQTPFIDFKRDDIDPVKWCDGRIWELRLKDGSTLWRTEGLDGRRSKIDVYVGIVDGKIKIVR